MEQNNGERIRDAVDESVRSRLDLVEEFSTLGSTNSYLLQQSAPMPGHGRVALAGQQTEGRGRRGNEWCSPALTGLYLSVSYTFQKTPKNFACLTLAVGTAVIAALETFGATGIALKWPNDLVLLNGKLGGILTELQPATGESRTVVVGLGLNLERALQLDGVETAVGGVSNLRQTLSELPDRSTIATAIVEELMRSLSRFEQEGFAAFQAQWKQHDWLEGKSVTVAMPLDNIRDIDGIASGVDDDGALLVKKGNTIERIVSGSVTLRPRGRPATSISIATQ